MSACWTGRYEMAYASYALRYSLLLPAWPPCVADWWKYFGSKLVGTESRNLHGCIWKHIDSLLIIIPHTVVIRHVHNAYNTAHSPLFIKLYIRHCISKYKQQRCTNPGRNGQDLGQTSCLVTIVATVRTNKKGKKTGLNWSNYGEDKICGGITNRWHLLQETDQFMQCVLRCK